MKRNILLLCHKPHEGKVSDTLLDHIYALQTYSESTFWVCSVMGDLPLKLDLSQFDAIVIHYSICLLNDYFLSTKAKQAIRDYVGLKVVFIQDEYRQVNHMVKQLAYLKMDMVFSCFPAAEVHYIYPASELPETSIYTNLTGYIPERLLAIQNIPDMKQRPLHVGYRARRLPYWYGELAYEKWNIVEQWQMHTRHAGLKTDLSYLDKDRIYGRGWAQFMQSCKTMLGVESGASVVDFTGELEHQIDIWQMRHPHDLFYSVQAKFLREHEGRYHLNQISPRCFEAIMHKTVLVLYEGRYSDILIPDRHYITLKKDFSNIAAVLAKVNDDNFLQAMADCAYQEIGLNPKFYFSSFVKEFDRLIHHESAARKKRAAGCHYTSEQFAKITQKIPLKNRFYQLRLATYQKLPLRFQNWVKGVHRSFI